MPIDVWVYGDGQTESVLEPLVPLSDDDVTYVSKRFSAEWGYQIHQAVQDDVAANGGVAPAVCIIGMCGGAAALYFCHMAKIDPTIHHQPFLLAEVQGIRDAATYMQSVGAAVVLSNPPGVGSLVPGLTQQELDEGDCIERTLQWCWRRIVGEWPHVDWSVSRKEPACWANPVHPGGPCATTIANRVDEYVRREFVRPLSCAGEATGGRMSMRVGKGSA